VLRLRCLAPAASALLSWFDTYRRVVQAVRDSGDTAPSVTVAIDTLTFDRVLIFLEAYALKRKPPRFAVHLLGDLQEVGSGGSSYLRAAPRSQTAGFYIGWLGCNSRSVELLFTTFAALNCGQLPSGCCGAVTNQSSQPEPAVCRHPAPLRSYERHVLPF
jgi:hypothetical protein